MTQINVSYGENSKHINMKTLKCSCGMNMKLVIEEVLKSVLERENKEIYRIKNDSILQKIFFNKYEEQKELCNLLRTVFMKRDIEIKQKAKELYDINL